MRSKSDLRLCQKEAVKFAKKVKKCGLFLDMRMGKTCSSLTVANDFLSDIFVTKVLVIAPLRVANTVWHNEAKEWDYLQDLNFSICTGSVKQRIAAIESKHDILVTNRENVQWLINYMRSIRKWPWDMLIIDESSGFKNSKSKRFRSLRRLNKFFNSVLLLSGTPSPKSYMNLWSQLYLIDSGARLGRTITEFRNRYFYRSGFKGRSWSLRDGSDILIKEKIKDVCVSMKAEDWGVDLPPLDYHNEFVDLPDNLRKQYDELEKEFMLSLESGVEILAPSGGTLVNKLLQFANGSIYDEDKKWHEIHSVKLNRLKEIIEDNEDENFIIAYTYKSDLKRIKNLLPQSKAIDACVNTIDLWNSGHIKQLLLHPAAAGHGLNLQFGGSIIIWFGGIWDLELYQQLNARLRGQGQKAFDVRIIHLLTKDTMDEVAMKAIDAKCEGQDALLEFIKHEKSVVH